MRFRPPVWLGVIYGLQAALQVLLVLGDSARAFHAGAAVFFALGTVWYFTMTGTVLDEHGISTLGRWRRVRHRWAEVSALGVRRQGDRYLTAVLQDGRKQRLSHVRAEAYPRVRDLMLAQEPTSARSER
jgi:hypothetical protein